MNVCRASHRHGVCGDSEHWSLPIPVSDFKLYFSFFFVFFCICKNRISYSPSLISDFGSPRSSHSKSCRLNDVGASAPSNYQHVYNLCGTSDGFPTPPARGQNAIGARPSLNLNGYFGLLSPRCLSGFPDNEIQRPPLITSNTVRRQVAGGGGRVEKGAERSTRVDYRV